MSDKIVNLLNDLIETSKNGEKGFQAAAEDTKNAELKALFQRRAADCGSGAAELQAVVTQLGGKPEDSGTIAGAVHRGWMNLKQAVAGRDDLAILEECERGEDVAKKDYSDALKETLPENVRAVIQKQYDGVLRNHDQTNEAWQPACVAQDRLQHGPSAAWCDMVGERDLIGEEEGRIVTQAIGKHRTSPPNQRKRGDAHDWNAQHLLQTSGCGRGHEGPSAQRQLTRRVYH